MYFIVLLFFYKLFVHLYVSFSTTGADPMILDNSAVAWSLFLYKIAVPPAASNFSTYCIFVE